MLPSNTLKITVSRTELSLTEYHGLGQSVFVEGEERAGTGLCQVCDLKVLHLAKPSDPRGCGA